MIQQDVHGYRCHAVLFVIRPTHGDRFVAQEAVGGVSHFEDVTQLFLRRRWPAGFRVPVSLCRCNDCETAGAVFVEELRNTGALGFALRAPVCPEEKEDDSSFQFTRTGDMRPKALASLHARRRTSLEADAINHCLNLLVNGRIVVRPELTPEKADGLGSRTLGDHDRRRDLNGRPNRRAKMRFGVERVIDFQAAYNLTAATAKS